MKRLLVLGGTRYLGKAIANKISKEEYEVVTLSRSEDSSIGKHLVCDRKNTDDLKSVLSYFNPHIILDMINFDKSDSKGICSLYDQGYCKNLSHYITLSSFFIYNHFEYCTYSERKINASLSESSLDGYTNRKIESEITLYDSKLMNISTILRLPFVFSSDDYSNRFQTLCKLALSDQFQVIDHPFRYSLLRKNDATDSIIKVIESHPIGIADLSNNGYVTSKDLLNAVKSFIHPLKSVQNLELLEFPYFVNRDICLSSQKLTIELSVLDAFKLEVDSFVSSMKY